MHAVKKMIYLDQPQERLLKRISAEEHVPETEVMRRALDLYARERLRDPLSDLIGAFSGGPTDAASNHNDYLLDGPHAG